MIIAGYCTVYSNYIILFLTIHLCSCCNNNEVEVKLYTCLHFTDSIQFTVYAIHMSFFWKSFPKAVWLQKRLQYPTMAFGDARKVEEVWDRSVAFWALLSDLFKAFNWLNHEIIIGKLNSYGFSWPTLKLNHDYLSDRKQGTKMIYIVNGLL